MLSVCLHSQNIENRRVAVIGAGIAGTTAALFLAKQGLTVDLFDREKAIFMRSSALPAHLYSGVQYFGDISDSSIQHCMRDAISFAKALPFCINPRPTVMAIAKKDIREPQNLERVCEMNQKVYEAECRKDPKNRVFGSSSQFYKTYTLEQLLQAQKDPQSEEDHWMASFAKYTNLDDLKFPVFFIREYGLDMRHAAGFMEQLIKENPNIRLHLKAEVRKVQHIKSGIMLFAETERGHFQQKFQVVIDASGSNLGALEAQLDIKNQRLVDMKMVGLFKRVKMPHIANEFLPEIYILGGKGYPAGTSFMSHISPINPAQGGEEEWLAINVTTPDCTYIKDGKQSNGGVGRVPVSSEVCPLAFEILNNPDSRKSRLHNMMHRIQKRHGMLAHQLTPVYGLAGSVDILGGNFMGRDSCLDAHPGKRLISLNITKGGAAVGVAKALCEELWKNRKLYTLKLDSGQQNLIFMPENINRALELTKARYFQLGFSEESARTYQTFEQRVLQTTGSIDKRFAG